MTKEKEVKELQESICQHFNDNILDGWSVNSLAEALYSAGFRKEREICVAKIANRIEEYLCNRSIKVSLYDVTNLAQTISTADIYKEE